MGGETQPPQIIPLGPQPGQQPAAVAPQITNPFSHWINSRNSALIQQIHTEESSRYTRVSLPPIRVLDFELFKILSSFPRFPDNEKLCVDITSIDRSVSLVVFISHCWLRGYAGAPGWDGKKHPDNASHDKFKLCVEGIGKTIENMASGAKKCYLWLDFGCINQDGDPAGELKQLDEIVKNCDCLFTPIYGEDTNRNIVVNNFYDDYHAAAWNKGPHSYTHRGWCRVEMLYAANIPVIEDKARAERCFQHGFKNLVLNSVRPHLLYGTTESRRGLLPLILPPLQNSFYDKLDPLKGELSVPSDRIKIIDLFEKLRPHFKTVAKIGYEGGLDSTGNRSGKGTYCFASGDVYYGDWQDNHICGSGTFRWANGDVYDGFWKDNIISGNGIFRFSNGDVFDGYFENGRRHGKGIYRFANGTIYDGEFKLDHDTISTGMYRYPSMVNF